MHIQKLGQITRGQDGAFWKGYLFRFNQRGDCTVHDMKDCIHDFSAAETPIATFVLDRAEDILPHSNSVMFGNEFFCEGDEFPLLYTNIYNNYSHLQHKMKGVTCVYRIQRKGTAFSSQLVQLIEVGFVEDPLWRSKNMEDVRPYGNFVIDRDHCLYYAFTMRDEDSTTRYFAFDLPKVGDGVYDEVYKVNRVVLEAKDIKSQFDCPYHRYIQGATYHDGFIYSTEGFTNDKTNPPAIRVIDVKKKEQVKVCFLPDYGINEEAELIYFDEGRCYYSDNVGNFYHVTF